MSRHIRTRTFSVHKQTGYN